MSNALAGLHPNAAAQAAGELSDQQIQLFFVLHVQRLFAPEHRGAPIQAREPVVEYMRRFDSKVRRCMAGQPSNRKRDLGRAAAHFRKRKGWRAGFPTLADACADALAALATEVRPGRAGNPHRRLGQTTILERLYVNRAFVELTDLALSHLRLDWARKLSEKSNNGRHSRGRALVLERAIKLGEADGVELSRRKVSEQIREYVKTAPLPTLNALNIRRPRRRPEPARPLFKAKGT
jgi:hypothetical protein